ncbi:Uncharacterized protein conserved in bacteria DUF2317 [Aspergillus parasiticus SU-1]|uniref:Uncharacterized protein n=5 Tax=Aspergillus subgen. Circumdati TaxID=2720871 RepID=A0A2G7FUD7_9EURO|nr:hypothetical protein BDV34DRAFT_221076 [Aspergillus parasiticus]KAB8218271.1 hypothetical protein BDV33DRAFT_205630 [Aspergillus novoparasiticus]KAE8319252.1 hypothetical protein BDV41DRAFT_570902 [Aspergillus transmontanensis]KAE8335874.1 hypothetical protein BDV24DRAFT_119430 [Aspergillus arachidicola]KJK60474.1 Uncharacterized protein conserved in bacteria DUF2317 [Aspergillus parasiticus SU-1]
MSDADQGWKPNGRPQSTMAQAFSSTLDSLFALDSDVHHLEQTVDERKFQMIIQNRELEELQAKIRATEERLKARKSVILDGSGPRSNGAQSDGGYQSTESASSATSPTDTAGHYSSGDEQRQHGQTRNS